MEPTPAPTTPPATRAGWWSRNWKWFVPTGCLTFIALIVAFVACIIVFVFGLMKSTDVYTTAVARARSNPQAIAALGTPMKEGLFLSGNTHVDGASGTADLAIPIPVRRARARFTWSRSSPRVNGIIPNWCSRWGKQKSGSSWDLELEPRRAAPPSPRIISARSLPGGAVDR